MLRWIAPLLVLTTPLARGEWTLASENVLGQLTGGARVIERDVRDGERAVRITGVYFSTRQGRLAVIDNPTPDRGKLGDAARAAGALAGVNGGYFHADWKPVGLEIAGGKTINGFERAKLLSGVFVVTKGKPHIVRSSQYAASKSDTEALQAGPFLVDGGEPPAGLSTRPTARRTAVATDGRGNWALLTLSHVSLADAGAILSTKGIFPDFPIERALNLDGGSSTALWASVQPEPFYMREPWSVRNYLVLLPLGN